MIIWSGLNIKIGIVQKVYEWQSDILAKGQLDPSYTFWTMPILVFSPVQMIETPSRWKEYLFKSSYISPRPECSEAFFASKDVKIPIKNI